MLCGKRSSGKNMLTNFLHGYVLKSLGKIKDFDIVVDSGHLLVTQEDDSQVIVDVASLDQDFELWAMQNMWPFVKQYAHAYSLKLICNKLFKIPMENLYGSDQDRKKKIDHLLWENMPISQSEDSLELSNSGPMQAREFMQYFGSEIMREIYPDVWVDDTINRIKSYGSALSIVSDARFSNEVNKLKSDKDLNVISIYLTRSPHKDSHISENGINAKECDAVLDNKNMSVTESCVGIIEILKEKGLIE